MEKIIEIDGITFSYGRRRAEILVDSRSLSAKARFAGCSGATVPGSQLCSI